MILRFFVLLVMSGGLTLILIPIAFAPPPADKWEFILRMWDTHNTTDFSDDDWLINVSALCPVGSDRTECRFGEEIMTLEIGTTYRLEVKGNVSANFNYAAFSDDTAFLSENKTIVPCAAIWRDESTSCAYPNFEIKGNSIGINNGSLPNYIPDDEL